MVRMFVYRVGIDPRGHVLLILADEGITRLLPMEIGQFEARAIAMALAGQRFERPLTHDLLQNVIETLGHRLEQVEVVKLENQTYFAEITLVDNETDRVVKIDSRPSDAIALALRFKAPIYVNEEVLDAHGWLPEQIKIEGEEEEGEGEEFSPEVDEEKLRRLLEDIDVDEDEGEEDAD